MQLSDDLKAFIDKPNFASLASLTGQGAPHAIVIWIGREGDRLLFATGSRSAKCKNTKHDPRVSISIADMVNPYETAHLRGRVVEWRADTDFLGMDKISHKYIGKPFPYRDNPEERVVLVVEVDKADYKTLPFEHTPPRS